MSAGVEMSALVQQPTDAERIYRYTHADGSVAEATVSKARQECTALGRMTVAEATHALAHADLAERLAAKGRAKREAEQAAEAKQEPTEAKPSLEQLFRSDSALKTKKPEAPQTLLAEPLVKRSLTMPPLELLAATRRPLEAVQPDVPVRAAVKSPKGGAKVLSRPIRAVSKENSKIYAEPIPKTPEVEADKAPDTLGLLPEIVSVDSVELITSTTEQAPLLTPQVLLATGAEMVSHTLAIPSEEDNQFLALLAEAEVTEDDDSKEFHTPRAFVEIQEAAQEFPVEKTLVMVAKLLQFESNALEITEAEPALVATVEICNDLTLLFQDQARAPGFESFAMTEEISEKLIALLQAIGYDQPQRALAQFMAERDITFIVHAVTSISELSKKNYWPEMLSSTNVTPLFAYWTIAQHVGSATLAFLRGATKKIAFAA